MTAESSIAKEHGFDVGLGTGGISSGIPLAAGPEGRFGLEERGRLFVRWLIGLDFAF